MTAYVLIFCLLAVVMVANTAMWLFVVEDLAPRGIWKVLVSILGLVTLLSLAFLLQAVVSAMGLEYEAVYSPHSQT